MYYCNNRFAFVAAININIYILVYYYNSKSIPQKQTLLLKIINIRKSSEHICML